MTQVSDTLITKLVHTVLIVLIVLYVVFIKKSVVESVQIRQDNPRFHS